jgi:hypothetical protein
MKIRTPLILLTVAALLLASPAGRAAAQDTPARTSLKQTDLLTPRAEQAIERGYRYLIGRQGESGAWGKSGNSVGVTSLCLIALMVQGNFPGEKPYGQEMEKALDFLLKESRTGMAGYMGTNMYSHGLATLALSELWGQTDRDDEIRDAIKDAVDIILASQNQLGGWRYNPEPSGSDVSVTAMQLVALNSAKQAGILVPDETINKAIRFIHLCREPTSGGFTYMAGGGAGTPGFARSAAAVFSLMMAGKHESSEVKGGIKYLQKQDPEIFRNVQWYAYGHYYASLVNYMAGEDTFEKWYPKIRDGLLSKQNKDGYWKTGGAGTDYSTAMSIITLGVPYAFVPAYQR